MIGILKESKSSNEEIYSTLKMLFELSASGTNMYNWGLESSCSLFADTRKRNWHLWNYFLISNNITKLCVMSFSLADPKGAAGDGLGFVPCSRNDTNTLRRRKMIFPVITHWQMPCLVFFMIATAREKLANPWSTRCQNTLQSWHNLDSVPSSSTMGYWMGYLLSGFSSSIVRIA